MKEYWLVQNLVYDRKHILVKTWWRQLIRYFGGYSQRVATIKARNEHEAKQLFKSAGFTFGIFD